MEVGDKLIKKRIGNRELDSVKYRRDEYGVRKRDLRLLDRARQCWDNMNEFRMQRARGMRYTYGDQWGDYVTVTIDGVKQTMTMREYLSIDGKIPQQANHIKTMVNTIVGVLVKEQNEPVCNAIDRDEQQYGELLTVGLQANNNKNRINKIYNLCARDFIIGGLAVVREHYGYREGEKRREDSWTKYIDPNYVFIDTTMRDPRFWDMTMIGSWYRMSFQMLAAQFVGHNGITYQTLKDIYRNSFYDEYGDGIELTDMNDIGQLDFMRPVKNNECCVAEIWTLETKERVRLHDFNDGTLDIIDADDNEMLKKVKAINKERIKIGKESGWEEDEIPLIETEFFIDTFWYCRMLAPDGTILWEEESPYPERAHPYSILATPFIDGRICGYIIDAIDLQDAINRSLVLQDWVVRNQVKGFVMMPKQLVPDEMTNEEFVRNSLNIGNVFFYDADKARGMKPEVFHSGAVSYDAANFINQLRQMMESTTAVSGALQGKTPFSGTSASLYAQQTANSSTPIASLLLDIRTFMEDSAIKKAKNIAKFYDTDRWKIIMGNIDGIFDNSNMNLNDVADIEFDVLIKESTETPMYRALADDYLRQFFAAGAISLEELLENSSLPFADKLLQKRQARQAEMEAAQNGAAQQGTIPPQTA